MSAFAEELRQGWTPLTLTTMAALKPSEQLNLSLEAEDSLFLRFNKGKVRQNTQVEQAYLDLTFQYEGRTTKRTITLTLNLEENKKRTLAALQALREEVKFLSEDPYQVRMQNRGTSSKSYPGKTPTAEQVVQDVGSLSTKLDLVGFFAGGPRISANCNSEGQNHWFSNENFFFDYSLYEGERAISSNISGSEWNREPLAKDLKIQVETLGHLAKPITKLKPGKYRTYLAPLATAELLSMFNWHGLGFGDYRRGRSCLKKIVEKELSFSPKFSLAENFELGLSPVFNSLGEVAPGHLSLIEKGNFVQLLTSTRSAKEFGVEANFAPPEEIGRSFEISAGKLPEAEVLKTLGTGLHLSHLHYLNHSDINAARITGMTRFAALWVENGEIVGPIQNLRFDHSLIDLFGTDLVELTREQRQIPAMSTYTQRQLGGVKVPGAMIEGMNFTL